MQFGKTYLLICGIIMFLVFLFAGGNAISAPMNSAVYTDSADQQFLLKWKPKIDEIVRPAFESERLIGAIVGISNGKSPFFIGYGSTNLVTGNIPNEHTIFEIGSITKVFTGLLLAKKVLEDKVALDEPVKRLLPPYFRIPRFGSSDITLIDLSTHYSGLPRIPTNMNPKHLTNPYKNYTGYKMREFLASYKLPREPGTEWEYSNLGVALLGYALGVKSNNTYKRMVFSEICNPLKLKDTRFHLNDEQLSRFAQGYNADFEKTPHWDFDVIAPAGGLRSTASDMLKFATAFLNENEPMYVAMEKTITPYRKSGIPDNEMGLGWLIMKKSGFDIPWHNGGTGGFSSFMAVNKKQKIALVVLSNTSAAQSGVVDDIAGTIMKCMLGIPYEDPKWPLEARIDPKLLDTYTGNYELISQDKTTPPEKPGVTLIVVSREGSRLVFNMDKKITFKLYPESDVKFFAKLVPLSITFSKDNADNKTHMSIKADNESSEWKKVSALQKKTVKL